MTVPKEESPFITMKELIDMTFPESHWVVEGLLRTGRKRPSLLAGRPEAGKSTLARQLILAVAQGQLFLERHTTRGEVCYWQTEEEVKDIKPFFIKLGYTIDDEEIHIFKGDSDKSGMETIADRLLQCPKINLVVIETLDDLFHMEDIKENTAARKAFAEFNTKLMVPFGHRVSFLALHHFKKADTAFSGDRLLGATNIQGKTDTKIFMYQENPDDERRVIFATKRLGIKLPKTYLVFDPQTDKSTLGETVADAERQKYDRDLQELKTAIINYVTKHPKIEHTSLIMSKVIGNSTAKKSVLRELVNEGFLVRTGSGNKGNPWVYNVPGVKTEEPTASAPVSFPMEDAAIDDDAYVQEEMEKATVIQ